ncbi:hypothetical protein ACOSQ3_032429 [Xanthoceras sorbifolium]
MANTISRRFTNICVFCGSSSGKNKEFDEAADQLGRVLCGWYYRKYNWGSADCFRYVFLFINLCFR